jgi:hypothetical protein
MKRVLLFLLLFAAGLGVLLLVQEMTREEPVEPPVEEVEPIEVPGPKSPEVSAEFGDQEGELFVTIKAPLSHRVKREVRPGVTNTEYLLKANEVRPVLEAEREVGVDVMQVYDLRDVTIELWNPETERLETELHAEEARVRLHVDEDGKLRFDEERANTLKDVDLVVHEGMPLVPLRANVPLMELRLADRRITSGSNILLEGSGLQTTGSGLEIDEATSSFRLLEDPRVSLRLEDGTRAVLSCAGTLEILAREDLGPDHISITARDGAHLDLRQDEPMGLDADDIVLVGRARERAESEEDGEGSFAPIRGEADGSVVLTLADGQFFGDRAKIGFDELGEPEAAILSGNPRLALELTGLETEPPPQGAEASQPLPLEVTGVGPLTVGLGPNATLDFAGPLQLKLPTLGATLDATKRLTGTHSEDAGFAILVASGDVVVRYEDSTLTAEEIEVGSYVDETGERVATLTAVKETRTVGVLEDGRAFTLVTKEGIVVERTGDHVTVPQAGQVELEIEGEGGFRARADKVVDLDVNAFAFDASGNVRFESDRGRGHCERLVAFARDQMDLYGSPEAPAHFEVPEGTLDGGLVSLDGDVLDVRDHARANVELGEQRYGLSSNWARLDRSGVVEGESAEEQVILDAGGDVSARTEGPNGWVATTRSDLFRARARETEAEDGSVQLEPVSVLASGDTRLTYEGEFRVEGEGERLEIDGEGNGYLEPEDGERIKISGELPRDKRSFEMTAHRVDFSPETLEAVNPDLEVVGFDVPINARTGEVQRLRAVAGRMVCDRSSVLFTDGVYLGGFGGGADGMAQTWSLDADKVLLTGIPADEVGDTPAAEAVHDLLAWGGFVATLGDGITVRGDHAHAIRDSRTLRMAGSPASLHSPHVAWEAEWFDLNLHTGFIRAGAGKIAGVQDASWSLEYASIEPVETLDATIQVVREPIVTSGTSELRASWALFWVDTREWAKVSGSALGGGADIDLVLPEIGARPAPHPQSLFGKFAETGLTRWLDEVYVEGNIEYSIEGQRKARAHSMYFDLIDGHGWMREFDLRVDFPYIERVDSLKLRARWMYHSANGVFRAERAVATLCEFEEPHYVVRIGDLNITPRMRQRKVPLQRPEGGAPESDEPELRIVEEHDGWDIDAGETAVELFKGIRIPLPPMEVPVDTDLDVDTSRISLGGLQPIHLGSAPKLGTFIGTTFSRELGTIASGFHNIVGGRNSDFLELDGKTDYRVSWNNSRGLLLGLTSEVRSPGLYWIDIDADGLLDQGHDKGLIIVPENQRDEWRGWYRARGRYTIDDLEWVDLVATYQSDPGFQSEFFESKYLRFEERETYAHWRKAKDENYYNATAEVKLEEFRTEVVEQPKLGHVHGRTKVAQLLPGVPLQYSSGTSLAYLKRLEGDPTTNNPLNPTEFHEAPYADRFGEQDALRLDTTHRLETPFDVGVAGIRATPFLEGRATGWLADEASAPTLNLMTPSLESDENPTRLALLGGIELATTVWRAFSTNTHHVISPFVGWRSTLALDQSSDDLVKYDEVENTLDGRFIDVGVRSRWENSATRNAFDLELSETFADDSPIGEDQVWLPLEMYGTWVTEIGGMGFGLSHDARYDLEAERTTFSRTLIGWEPIEPVEVGVGYHSARGIDPASPNAFAGRTLYNAMSVSGTYAFSPKWEIQGLYTFSTLGEGLLASEFGVRRFGHDFVFEISTRFVAGEGGGTGFEFDVIPLLAYKDKGGRRVRYWRESGF